MKKLVILFVLILSVLVGKAQVYQEMPQYGYRANRMAFDTTLQIPTVCGVPTLRSAVGITKKAAIAYDSCNGRFYTYNPTTQVWSQVTGGGGTIPNLQQVTDVGDTTTNDIYVNRLGLFDGAWLGYGNFKINDEYLEFHPSALSPYNTWGFSSYFLTMPRFFSLPDTSGIIALSVNNNFADSKGNITLSSVTNATNATRLITSVYNNSGITITKGTVVYINGRHSSNYPTILPAQANSETNSYKTFAIVENDILDKNVGLVVQAGNIGNLNLPTATYTDGDIVYLSPTVSGGITITKPTASNHICKLGSVTRAHPTLGSIEVKIENGWQMDELSDVQVAAVPNDSTLLQFSRVDSLWHDVSVVNAIGTKYIKPSDTASMLTNYARTNLVNTKLNISDTSSMLSPYLRNNIASATYVSKSDSSTYYTKYRSDTSRTNIYSAINNKFTTPTGWTDYFSSSTIVGTTSSSGVINYIVMGKVLYLQFDIQGTSSAATTYSFTIPFTTVASKQFGFGTGINNSTAYVTLGIYVAESSNVVRFSNNSANYNPLSPWLTTGTRRATGFMILNIN